MRANYSVFRGAMLGVAVGDAMGSAIDRASMAEIRQDYGPYGLLGYDLVNGYAEVTSHTQLMAFCANGLLLGLTRGPMQGKEAPLVRYIGVALKEWSRSQQFSEPAKNHCWLSTVPELKRRRCMDTRILDALSRPLGTPEQPQYRSDQPTSLTEVVPIVLMAANFPVTRDAVVMMATQTIALTHGHPEAFLTGGVLAGVLYELLFRPEISVEEAFGTAMDAVQRLYGQQFPQMTHLWEMLQFARTMVLSPQYDSVQAMEMLRCRTATEVLMGAYYACATCGEDFDGALITAVNHSGRSSAVGAITGGILGMKLGQEALPEFYLECLEAAHRLGELANDLYQSRPVAMDSILFDDEWDRKYLHGGVY